MKKILIVGGGVNQLPLILASKTEGYEVVVVDYAGESCPGFAVADRLYPVSTTDEEAIFEVAQKEGIDGIISNSELSMLLVNRIAERMGLIGNPVEGIQSLISKNRFRNLQNKAGVYAPLSREVSSVEEAVAVAEGMRSPIIVKPCESSGSRGCKVIDGFRAEEISAAFQACWQYSRNRNVVMEEYVTMPSLRTIEGDIFVFGDSIIWDGLFYTTRPAWAPIVPMTYTAPLLIDDAKLNRIKTDTARVLRAAGIRYGEFNMEGFFTETGEFFIIEINARQGGNFLPVFLRRFSGIDYNRLLVTTCVNDDRYFKAVMESVRHPRFAIMHSVYSRQEGYYKGVRIDPSIENKVTRINELLSMGEKGEKCIDGSSIVASVDLEFDSLEELYYFTPGIVDCIQVELSDVS